MVLFFASSGGVVLTLPGVPTRTVNTASLFYHSADITQANIVVTGATATPANQIIGPWATFGTSSVDQSDYAVYNGSAQAGAYTLTVDFQATGGACGSGPPSYDFDGEIVSYA